MSLASTSHVDVAKASRSVYIVMVREPIIKGTITIPHCVIVGTKFLVAHLGF